MTAAERPPDRHAEHDLEALRGRIVYAGLTHVGFDGWSQAALMRGATDAGLAPSAVLRAFPGGPREAVFWFSRDCDRRMVDELAGLDVPAMRVRDRIARAVRIRLQLLEPYRDAMRRTAIYLALPHNAALGLKCLYHTVDDIWHAAGDTSTDHNFYTKRLLLAGVVSSTTLYWLDDASEGRAGSWAFLDRRIADAMSLPGAIGRLTGRLRRPAPGRRRRYKGRDRRGFAGR